MLLWALASGQINMRKVDGWQTLSPQNQSISRLTLLPETILSCSRRVRQTEFQPHSGGGSIVSGNMVHFKVLSLTSATTRACETRKQSVL
jgi:hypothetical protein